MRLSGFAAAIAASLLVVGCNTEDTVEEVTPDVSPSIVNDSPSGEGATSSPMVPTEDRSEPDPTGSPS